MREVLFVLIGVASLVVLVALPYLMAMAINRPRQFLELMSESNSDNRFAPPREKAKSRRRNCFLLLILVGLFAFTYVGAKGLLFWMGHLGIAGVDGGLKDAIAMFVAIAWVYYLGELAHAHARAAVRLETLVPSAKELQGLVLASPNLASHLVSMEKRIEEAPLGIQDAMRPIKVDAEALHARNIAWLEEHIADRDRATERAKREADEKAAMAAVALARNNLVTDHLAAFPAAVLEAEAVKVELLGNLRPGAYCMLSRLEPMTTWASLRAAFTSVAGLTKKDIDSGSGPEKSLTQVLRENLKEVAVDPPWEVFSQYGGETFRQHTHYYVKAGNALEPYLPHLLATETPKGLLESFFMAQELPKIGAFDHGLYDRDYHFVLSAEHLAKILGHGIGLKPGDPKIKQVNRPAGLRVERISKGYRVSCLAVYPNNSISDRSIRVVEGRISLEPEEELLNSGIVVLY